MVRMFAGLLQGQDARTEVPPRGLFAGKLRRGRPYIYSEAEVARIVARASTLPSRYGMGGLVVLHLVRPDRGYGASDQRGDRARR